MESIKDQHKEDLAKNLDKYIKKQHTQEECIGFIDGFNAKTDLLESQRLEALDRLKYFENECHELQKQLAKFKK